MQGEFSQYQAAKIRLAEYLPIDRDVLHVLIGGLLVLGAVFLWRRRQSVTPFVWALAIASVAALGMEYLDMQGDLQTYGSWRWRASLLDILRTISVPALSLFVVWRLTRRP